MPKAIRDFDEVEGCGKPWSFLFLFLRESLAIKKSML